MKETLKETYNREEILKPKTIVKSFLKDIARHTLKGLKIGVPMGFGVFIGFLIGVTLGYYALTLAVEIIRGLM